MVTFVLEEKGILGCTVKRGPARTDLEDGWVRMTTMLSKEDTLIACKRMVEVLSKYHNLYGSKE